MDRDFRNNVDKFDRSDYPENSPYFDKIKQESDWKI